RIHELSPRFDRPFVSLNCGAFPETLLESELFGFVKGAFTGATHSKPGLFQAAHGGTLFLDEIGEMSLPMQVKLLRVLQDRKVRPLGSTEESSVDVRVIAATNKDLRQLVAEKSFREDLYYRISVIPLHMPPLRERSDDIPLLALHFLQRYSEQMNKPPRGLSAEALEALRSYSWPGNVRELENVIERAVALETGEGIGLRSLAEHISRLPLVAPGELLIPDDGVDFQKHIEEQERAYLLAALEKAGGVRTRAAELLGISYRSFRHYAKKHNV
ncbi:MAG TPA: sigma 54-interacting transcriptional regulator, partial [Candidatus Acidoferrales bacterium]